MRKLNVRKMLVLMVVCLMGISLIGCKEQKVIQLEETESKNIGAVNADTSWYTKDGSAITNGMYVVGDDMVPGNYTFTCNDGYGFVAIFETKDDYVSYHESRRGTIGEQDEAITKNVLDVDYLNEGEVYSVRVDEGFVVLVDGFKGTIKNANADENDDTNPVSGKGEFLLNGLYRSGDIEEGKYILTNDGDKDEAETLSVLIFEDRKAYDNFMAADQSTVGDYSIAVEQNALYDEYLDKGQSCYLNVTENSIIVLKGAQGYLEPVRMSWSE